MLRLTSCLLLLLLTQLVTGQRNYVPNSVLASGDWYKIAINKEGIYKIDYRFLKAIGVQIDGLASSAIRLFGNGGQMLSEKAGAEVHDDLLENAIQVIDGGDGSFNEGDYFLFYASGPDGWLKDSLNRKFNHRKNLYTDYAYYFITTGGNGRRIATVVNSSSPVKEVDSYDARYYYELDSLNLLSSGKHWYGQQFNTGNNQKNNYTFQLPLEETVNGSMAMLITKCIARSIGSESRYSVKLNNTELTSFQVPAVSASSYDVFAKEVQSVVSFPPTSPYHLQYSFTSGSFGAQGWLDWFELFSRKHLVMPGSGTLLFRDWNSVSPGTNARFTISKTTASTQVWDITIPAVPQKLEGLHSATNFSFINDCSLLREYIAFNQQFMTPVAIGKIVNQDLHQPGSYDYLIIAPASHMAEAKRVAAFHELHDNLKSLVVNIEAVYNEFASGSPDPTAIRNFVKMFYDRSKTGNGKKPKYLLLFGDASYDYKNRLKTNGSLIPAYESEESLDPLSSYTSDDYFGFLDDWEDINNANAGNLLDIGIGRIPAQTAAQAKAFVDKLIRYKDSASLGTWRNELSFIADDEDFNLHLQDAEVAVAAASSNTLFNHNKIYLDAYKQESNASGSRYPSVNKLIEKQVENGSLILNYNGHGSFRRLAEEVVLDKSVLETWYNPYRLPLFITATCDFAPYDNPSVTSLGEEMLLRRETGAIALMTTTRLVFAYSNRIINQQYLQVALAPKPGGGYASLGEAVQLAKNNTYQSFSDIVNNRKFTLLGDPALTLNFPKYQVQVTKLNGVALALYTDTLKAFQQVTIDGEVHDPNGQLLTSFNGTVHYTVFDKALKVTTLANDPASLKENFQVQENAFFKGRSSVSGGRFSFRFLVPKDINYQVGKGKISFYVEDGREDGNGGFTGLLIGGSLPASADTSGPEMVAWIDRRDFKSGQTVNEAPVLIVDLWDSSGININRSAIGHELVAILDGDNKDRFELNDAFSFTTGSYQQGTLVFQMPRLAEGRHTLLIKSWDNANNSKELQLVFYVKKEVDIIEEVLNYPNPVTAATRFCFTHKRPGEKLDVRLTIFTVQGQLIKSVEKTINAHTNRSCDIEWEGRDEQGIKAGKGIYIYNIEIRASDGTVANKSRKLVVM